MIFCGCGFMELYQQSLRSVIMVVLLLIAAVVALSCSAMNNSEETFSGSMTTDEAKSFSGSTASGRTSDTEQELDSEQIGGAGFAIPSSGSEAGFAIPDANQLGSPTSNAPPQIETPTPIQNTVANPYPPPSGAYPGPGSNNPYPGVQITDTPSGDPYPSPTQNNITDPYPAPGITQTERPTATPLPPTVTPTPTKTPLPTPIPLDARMQATDPETVNLESGFIQFVEFFAYWDGFSKSMASIVHELEARYEDQIIFVYLDIDDPATDIFKEELGYEQQPEFFLIDGEGEFISQWQGLVDIEDFTQVFDAVLRE